jgi:cation diffusion facilitator family transporter
MHVSLNADREKRWVALTSLIGAAFITTLKIVVGVATQSLGILAEAAHSGLDLVAAAMTFLAVRWSGLPADRKHPFGHGKFENLSAFLEALLLLVTCVAIVWGAVHRLFFKPVLVEVTFWSFAVMILSIIVDYSRSRALKRAAKKYNSQALEADGLHFETDIWSSCAVLLGLGCVLLGQRVQQRVPALEFLHHADAVAALAVAFIAGTVTWRLTRRTVDALVDTAPPGYDTAVQRAVAALPEVRDCHEVRIRSSGSETFVELHITLAAQMPLEHAHAVTERVEEAVRGVIPHANVLVHPEPV